MCNLNYISGAPLSRKVDVVLPAPGYLLPSKHTCRSVEQKSGQLPVPPPLGLDNMDICPILPKGQFDGSSPSSWGPGSFDYDFPSPSHSFFSLLHPFFIQ